MPHIILPGLLRQRVADARLDIDAMTAGATIQALERRYPTLKGWVLDEQGHVRTHVRLFVNGTEAAFDTGTEPSDELHIVPAISGG